MRTVDIGGNTYQIGRMNVFKQLHVGRRIAPLLFHFYAGLREGSADAVRTLTALKEGNGELDITEESLALSTVILAPLTDAISKLSDADFDFVLFACLAVTERKQDKAWARVLAADGTTPMFADMDAPVMLSLAAHAIMENLGGFFPSAGQNSGPE